MEGLINHGDDLGPIDEFKADEFPDLTVRWRIDQRGLTICSAF